MVIHYPPARLRQNSDQPTAITDVLVTTSGSSSRTGDIPLGTPTCSARSRHGRWALYPNGDQVVVVWPGGALAGPPAEVARELDRLGDGHDDLDRARRLGDPAVPDRPRRRRRRPVVVDPGADLVDPGGGLLAQRPHQPARLRRPHAGQPARRTLTLPHPPIPLPDPSPEPAPARAA